MTQGKLGNILFATGLADRLDPVCDRFEDAWLAGGSPRLEDFLLEAAEADRPALLRELLALELDYRGRRGERPLPEQYLQRFPELADTLALQVEVDHSAGEDAYGTRSGTVGRPTSFGLR